MDSYETIKRDGGGRRRETCSANRCKSLSISCFNSSQQLIYINKEVVAMQIAL